MARDLERLTDEEKRRRQQNADRLLSDPAYTEAFEETRQQILRIIETSPHADAERREDCYYTLRALRMLDQILRAHGDRGRLISTMREMRSPEQVDGGPERV